MCSSVDLPAPEGPMIDTKSPSSMSRLIRRRTKVLPGPWTYDFSMLRIRMSAPISLAPQGDHRVDPGGAARRHDARQEGDAQEQCGDRDQGGGIGGADA